MMIDHGVGSSDHFLKFLYYTSFLTPHDPLGVDYRGQNTVKFVQNEKYSAKSADFFRFLLYLCHVIDDFACLDLQHYGI